ncbi:hypothetical protein R80B4_01624 [Fibrobacteres bacterium R8-0-B4]
MVANKRIVSGWTLLLTAAVTVGLLSACADKSIGDAIAAGGHNGRGSFTDTYTITFNANGGSVTPASGATNTSGYLTSLPVPARSGYTFDGWYTSSSGGTRVTTSYRFNGNTVIYAHWTQNSTTDTYTVTVSSAGSGASGGGEYSTGVTVSIFAGTPPSGYAFKNWTTSSNGAIFANVNSAATTFTMPANPVTVTANFEADAGTGTTPAYTVTVSSAGYGASGGGSYTAGTAVTVTAGTPPSGYQFKEWTSSPAGVIFVPSANSPTVMFSMPAGAVTVTAVFETQTPPVTPGGNVSVTVGGYAFEMVPVTGGTFTMGCTGEQGGDCESDESPTHSVTLNKDYYIGKYEVTQGLWKAVMGSLPSSLTPSSSYGYGDNYPVYYVSWNDIVNDFIPALNRLTKKTFRLPTEAEWEYAARGGKSGGYKYSGSNTLGDVAWYWDNSGGTTNIVGTKSPNELGIYDMSGNVWEWVSDWYNSGYYNSSPTNNPTGPPSGSYRVFRGGGWFSYAGDCRVSSRDDYFPGVSDCNLGFRLVLLSP